MSPPHKATVDFICLLPVDILDLSLIFKMKDDSFSVKNILCTSKTLWGRHMPRAHAKMRDIWGNT